MKYQLYSNAWIVSKRGKAETQLGDCDMWVLPFLSLYCKLNNALKVSNKFRTLIWTHMFTVYEHVKTCKPNFLCAVRTLNFTVDPALMEKYSLNFLSIDKSNFLFQHRCQNQISVWKTCPDKLVGGHCVFIRMQFFGTTHELEATRKSLGRDKSLLVKCFVFVWCTRSAIYFPYLNCCLYETRRA